MSYIFGQDVDFNYNESLRQRLENQLSFPTLTAAEKGFAFFHTANEKFYGWTGTTWIDFSLGGGGGSFLPLAGGNMTGDIDMDLNDVIDLGAIYFKHTDGTIVGQLIGGKVIDYSFSLINPAAPIGEGSIKLWSSGVVVLGGSTYLSSYDAGGIQTLQVNNDGLVQAFAGGITEGTWTPVLTDSGAGATYTVGTITSARYTKIGTMVLVEGEISSISTSGTASGFCTLGGLPFTVSAGSSLAISRFGGVTGSGNMYQVVIGSDSGGASTMVFKFKTSSTSPAISQAAVPLTFTAGYMTFSGVFYTTD
jgi:hypothetical protein